MEIDIGNNMTELLEKLAIKIGTTADKIFPWYLNQQFIEGITFFIVLTGLLVITCSIAYKFHKSADYYKWWGFNEYVALTSSLFGMLFLLILCAESATIISQIINPEYYAFKSLTYDLSKLLGK